MNIKFERIQSHKNRLYFLCGFVCVVVLLVVFVVTRSHAKYRVTESIPLVNGTINYTLPDLNIVSLYIDGVEATELDSSKTYTLDTTQSTCTYKDGTEIENLSISYDSETGGLSIKVHILLKGQDVHCILKKGYLQVIQYLQIIKMC